MDSSSDRKNRRVTFLRELGVDEGLIPEMLTYCEALIDSNAEPTVNQWPMDDEPFAAAWQQYADEAERDGAWEVLSRYLIQLSFPVGDGIAESTEYLAATRKGVRPLLPVHPSINNPEGISITLHPTPAGRIPVISVTNRGDFVTLVQTLLRKNKPVPIPDSMGASMVAGYTNWDRVRRFREDWEKEHPFGDWNAAFKEFAQQKPLYQDRFILLSGGNYSGVSAKTAETTEADWKKTSIDLRREHECVHYFTRRVLGSMRNSLLDELVADAVAVKNVTGELKAQWLTHFFGIENWPDYRKGGRLENYVPDTLSACFSQLTELMNRAIENVADYDSTESSDLTQTSPGFVQALCSCSLDELARPDGVDLLSLEHKKFDC